MFKNKKNERLRELAKRQFEISHILNEEYFIDDDELVELAHERPESYQRLLELTNELIALSTEEAYIQGTMKQYELQEIVLENLMRMVESQKTILEAGK